MGVSGRSHHLQARLFNPHSQGVHRSHSSRVIRYPRRVRLRALHPTMMENANPEQELPAEILDEIFSLAIPSLLIFEDAGTLLNIGLVCHAWHIALSPWWSRLRVGIQPEEEIPCNKICSWFSNAGHDTPKTLHLYIHNALSAPVCRCADTTSHHSVASGPSLRSTLCCSSCPSCRVSPCDSHMQPACKLLWMG
jgi:hypothetical protein